MQVQWYPGHMSKAKRAMKEDVKIVDLVIELLDARAPLSSRNPEIDEIAKNKSRLVLLNKADLADKSANLAWERYFKEKGILAVSLDSRKNSGLKPVSAAIMEACKEKIERDRKKGILNRPVRAMVAGIPNVGKSTFINSLSGKASTKTGNKPGVTKGTQWIKLNKQVELLDTPGILWPKFEDQKVGLYLAFLGSINDQIIDQRELACELIKKLRDEKEDIIKERYGVVNSGEPYEVLEKIAEARAALLKGGLFDTEKASRFLMDDFRSGRLGNITLERP